MIPFLDWKMRFIIRLTGDRHLVYHGYRVCAVDLASSCSMIYAERIIKGESSGEKPLTIEFVFRRLKLPGRKEQLCLVVVKGSGREPLMLLSNLELIKSRKSLLFVVLVYIRRWRIEKTIRFAPGWGQATRPTASRTFACGGTPASKT